MDSSMCVQGLMCCIACAVMSVEDFIMQPSVEGPISSFPMTLHNTLLPVSFRFFPGQLTPVPLVHLWHLALYKFIYIHTYIHT